MTIFSINALVNFDWPILGSEVPAVVQQFVGPEKFVLAQDPNYPEWIMVGQRSEHRYEHLLVRDPIHKLDGLMPDFKYTSLSVATYRWDGVFRVEDDELEKSLQAVKEFSTQFKLALNFSRGNASADAP